jgi:hypothetical protein
MCKATFLGRFWRITSSQELLKSCLEVNIKTESYELLGHIIKMIKQVWLIKSLIGSHKVTGNWKRPDWEG